MLTIRQSQMEVLRRSVEADFLARLAERLRRDLADALADLTPEAAIERIEWAVGRARARGIVTENSVAMFVTLMFLVSPQFDDYPPFRERLAEDPDRKPGEALEVLLSNTYDDEWAAAREQMGTHGWPEKGQA